jgi:hypothetical protein
MVLAVLEGRKTTTRRTKGLEKKNQTVLPKLPSFL